MSIAYSDTQLLRREFVRGPDNSFAEIHIIARERVHLEHIWTTDSNLRHEHKGIGTALFKQIVQRANEEKARVTAIVPSRSRAHLFLLKMGMIPEDYCVDYVAFKYGAAGYEAIKSLTSSAVKVDQLRKILQQEENCEEVTEADVSKKREFLLSLLTRKTSFLQGYFIPKLLAFLRTENSSKYLPDSRCLGSCLLRLSDAGKARWSLDFEHGFDFKPFSTFQHLEKFMTPEQKQELEALCEKRGCFK